MTRINSGLAVLAVLCGIALPIAGAAQQCVPPAPARTKITFFELAFEQIQWNYFTRICEPELVAGCAKGLANYSPAADYRAALQEVKTKADMIAFLERLRVDKVGDIDGPSAACLRGMASVLDGRSAFLDVSDHEAYWFSALRDTLGFEIATTSDDVRVSYIVEGGPAALGGLAIGDVIKEIGGIPVSGWGAMEIARASLGTSPTSLLIKRVGNFFSSNISVARQPPSSAPPTGRLVSGSALLTVQRIAAEAPAQLIDLLDRLRRENGGALRGIVLDLRGAKGGQYTVRHGDGSNVLAAGSSSA